MAIDKRHTQIKEGAGLEESRLNVEFIEWLRKWSTPLLIVIAAVALTYVLYNKYHERQAARVSEAFASYEAASASANPSPASLLAVADDYKGVRAVPILARLAAADAYLAAVRRGVDPGAVVDPTTGKVQSETDLMDEAEREANLAEAGRLYQAVLDECAGKAGMAIHAVGASFGLAAVAESRGDAAAARSAYEGAAAAAESAGFTAQAKIARERMASLEGRLTMPTLYEEAALPKVPWAVDPPAPPASDPAAAGAGIPTPLGDVPAAPTPGEPPAGERPSPLEPAAPAPEQPTEPPPP